MQKFISCDWGTSTLKLKVIDASRLKILARVSTNEGIANSHRLWKESGTGEEGKLHFYQAVINDKLKELERQLNTSFNGIEMVISGMASSSIGMMELPYHDIPFSMDG